MKHLALLLFFLFAIALTIILAALFDVNKPDEI